MIKQFNKIYWLIGIGFLALFSCKKAGELISATSGTRPVLTSSTNTLNYTVADSAANAVTFAYTSSDYGYKAALNYDLQFSYNDSNFSSFKDYSLSTDTMSISFTVANFNSLLLGLNYTAGVTDTVYVRLESSVSGTTTGNHPLYNYSDTVQIIVTPYSSVAWAYVPGDYQGWNPATADSLISLTSNNIYVGIIQFPDSASAFKITPAKSWDKAYGDGGNGTLSASGGNLVSPGAGSYQITANLTALTYSMTYFQWSIIGDATIGGWNTDTDMKYNNGDSTWNVTTPLVPGGLKFRKNHDWGTNYGGSGGTLALGGDNVNITTAGTYLIKLNIHANTYTLTKQ